MYKLSALVLLLLVAACKDSPTAPPPSAGQVRLSMQFSTQAAAAAASAFPTAATNAAFDSLVITRARFVLEHIELKGERDSVEFKTSPTVADLDLSSALHDFALSTIPFGTYRELEFEVHRVDSSDLTGIPTADHPHFADFLSGSSVIIDGFIFQGGTSQPFSYHSRIKAEQELELSPPLVVSASNSTANVTMSIQSGGWFRGSGGALLDPRDAANSGTIDTNLKASIRVFEDENRDGHDD